MPLLAATRPGWFEILEQGLSECAASAHVLVYHPDGQGRLRFERGRRVEVHVEGADSVDAAERLRRLGAGGYFELRRGNARGEDGRIVVCAEPFAMHSTACDEPARARMLDALLQRRFHEALALYTQHCATCRSRPTCKSVTMVERNAPRLVALSASGGARPVNRPGRTR